MEMRYVAAVAIVIFVVLFGLGFLVGGQSIDVAGCTASWKATSITVTNASAPDLCSSSLCTASPADQQHNAIVDALVCACQNATASQFSDAAANGRIQDVVKAYFGYDASAQDFCSQSGQYLVKRAYG